MTTWFETVDRFRSPVGAGRIAQFADALARFPTGHMVDLAAGHGIFSRVAADLGWRVTAVDVREARFPDDPRITWVTSDVRSFQGFEDADVVACLGLWYHLTLEDQRQLAQRVAPRPLIVDTHFALPAHARHLTHAVGDLVTQDGFEGRLYAETDWQDRNTASWGNESSFWPTTEAFERQLRDAGYDIFEHVSPAVAVDRHFVIARSFTSEQKAALDARVSAYNDIVAPDAAPRPLPGAAPVAVTPRSRPRRYLSGAKRRLKRRLRR